LGLHLLATTRLPSGAAGHIAWVTLGEMPEADALALLEKHRPFTEQAPVGRTSTSVEHEPSPKPDGLGGATAGLPSSGDTKTPTAGQASSGTQHVGSQSYGDTDRKAAQQIVRRLAGFALAVELVGAYLAAHPSATHAGLADGLGLDDLDLLAEDQDVELRRHNHERRLQAVLSPTLAGLSEPERLAVEYAACLPPDHAPLPWLRQLVVAQFPELAEPNRFGDPWHKLCDRLLRLAIFSRAEGEGHNPRLVRIHRLVQDVVRRELSERELSARQQAIEALVRERDGELKKTTRWQEARWEIEPFEALANLWADNGHASAAWLLNQTATYWHPNAEWTRTEPLMRRALAIDEQSYGALHPNVAIRLNNLAALLKATNRLAEAEPLMRRALAIDEQSYGALHPDVARDLNNLAQLLKATNRLTEAEPLMRRALAIDEQSYGALHPDVAIDLNNLAQLLQATNRLAEAEPLMRRALAIIQHSLGEEHPHTLTVAKNLAALEGEFGK